MSDAATRRLRDDARAAFEAGIAAAEPRAAVARALSERPPETRPVLLLALGKAAVPMTRGALDVLGERVARGLAVTKDGHSGGESRVGPVEIVEAAHPEPDARSERAGRRLLELAASRRPGEAALVLLSGGGSSLAAAPLEGLPLAALVETFRALLSCGAPIHLQNAVRRHLTQLGDGGLARALGSALVLVLPDVTGHVSDVASGPCLADGTSPANAAALLRGRCSGERVAAAVQALTSGPRRREVAPPECEHVLVGSCAISVDAAGAVLEARGHAVVRLGAGIQGDVNEVARDHLARLLDPAPGPRAFVGGGEPTVVVSGSGKGGRNQHLAALVARGLASARVSRALVFASVATDGTDGPTSAAGGLVDTGTWDRARAAGLDPLSRLAELDTLPLLLAAGDLVVTGPTGTNVMDLHVGLVE